jgi:integrase
MYRWALDQHLTPRLGRRRIATIVEEDVTELIAAMRKPAKGRPQGYAPWTIRAVLTPLSRVLGYAVKRGMLARNPVRELERGERPAGVERREKRILTSDEIEKLLGKALPTYRPILATLTFAGLRLGEALGLVWADLDLDGGFVRVRKQLSRDGLRVEPKTPRAKRDVVIPPALVKLLLEHKPRARSRGQPNPVFASESGRPLHWRNVSARGIEKAADRAGLNGKGQEGDGSRATPDVRVASDPRLEAGPGARVAIAGARAAVDHGGHVQRSLRAGPAFRRDPGGDGGQRFWNDSGTGQVATPGDRPPPGRVAKWWICRVFAASGDSRRQAWSALQAGGRWFEPGSAHQGPWRKAETRIPP